MLEHVFHLDFFGYRAELNNRLFRIPLQLDGLGLHLLDFLGRLLILLGGKVGHVFSTDRLKVTDALESFVGLEYGLRLGSCSLYAVCFFEALLVQQELFQLRVHLALERPEELTFRELPSSWSV